MRIKKGFLEITAMKREREGPSANKAYPIPAATVMAFLFLNASSSSTAAFNVVRVWKARRKILLPRKGMHTFKMKL